MAKISVSLSDELDSALEWAASDRNDNKSRLIETLLRENSFVNKYVQMIRAEPKTTVFAAHSQQSKQRRKELSLETSASR